MEWYSWVIAIVLGVSLGILLSNRKNSNMNIIHIIDEKDFKDNMRKGQLIDIRSKEDFEMDKIKGAKNISKKHILSKYSKVRKDQAVFLYCNDGKKSTSLAKKMSKDDYKAIYVLEGGVRKDQ